MNNFYSWQGLSSVERSLERLINPDATPLMRVWQDVLTEDNRAGVLSGLGADDIPLAPTKYRTSKAIPTTPRLGGNMGRTEGKFKPGTDRGPFVDSPNLPSRIYRKLTGPPLAPRGDESRVISNYVTGYTVVGNRYQVVGAWADVVSPSGFPFLSALFQTRDIAGLRAWGRSEIERTLQAWIDDLLANK